MKGKSGWLGWVGPGLLTLAADRAVKWAHLSLASSRETVLNSGMAFGMFSGNSGVILALSALLIGLCVFLILKMRPRGLAPIALSMIAGGALGNMIDRAIYGSVIDMFPFFGWFVFNAADVGVVAGAVLCGWSLLFRPQDWSKK